MYGRPGLVRRRPLLRAAAVGGTFAAGRAMGRRAADQASAADYPDQRSADTEGQGQPQMQAGQPAQGTGTAPGSAADQLGQLAELHQQGALTDEEFAAAKAKVLGSS
jgi:Short C-terminal domain